VQDREIRSVMWGITMFNHFKLKGRRIRLVCEGVASVCVRERLDQ